MMTDLRKQSDSGGAGNWAGDAYPAEQPQAENDAEQEHDAYMPLRADYTAEGESAIPKEYNWSLTGTHISVSDSFQHNDLFDAMNHSDNSRPHAWGTVQVSYNWEAVWEISGSNMSLGMVESRLRKYSKDQGWQHVNIIDHEGMPMGNMKVAADPGVGDGNYPDKIWKVRDWPADLAQDVPSYMFKDHADEEVPRGPIPCSECGQVLPTFAEWRKHVDQYHLNPNKEPHTLVVSCDRS